MFPLVDLCQCVIGLRGSLLPQQQVRKQGLPNMHAQLNTDPHWRNKDS